MAQTAEYKRLKKIWYKKLKESGFNDIETGDVQVRLKGGSSSSRYKKAYGEGVYQQTRQEYYYMAHQFLHGYEFKSGLDKAIWEYHVEGISIRKIAYLLKKAGITKFYKSSMRKKPLSPYKVWLVVNAYRKIMLGK